MQTWRHARTAPAPPRHCTGGSVITAQKSLLPTRCGPEI